MSFIALINNLALLLVLTIPYEYILRKWGHHPQILRTAKGILFASLTIIGMKVSVPFAPGIIFDARSVFISVSAVFGGPVVVGITALISASYRFFLGGTGVPMGIGVIASSTAVGLFFYYLRIRGHQTTRLIMLLIMGVVVHLLMIAWMFTLPSPYSTQTLTDVAPRILIVFSLGTLFLGKILTDIEVRIQSEKQMKETEEQLHLAVETAQLGIWHYDIKTKQLEWNKHLLEIYDIDRETFQNNTGIWRSQIHPQDKNHAQDLLDTISKGQKLLDSTFRIIRPSGEIRHIQASGSPIYNTNNEIIGVIGINIDITKIQKNQETLKERESFLKAIFDHSLNGIIVADDGGTYLSVNQAAADILGYSTETLLGMNVSELQTVQEQKTKDLYQTYVHKGQEIGAFETLTPNGDKRIVQYHAIRIDTDFNLSIITDITKQRQMEMEAQKTNNLASLGLLAGGIAHDFNNILTGITGNLSLLQMTIDKNSESYEILTEALEAAFRTYSLTQQLMTFAKGGAPIKEITSIQNIIKKTTQQSLRGANTKPIFQVADNLPIVHVDTGQISQVIQNLVINADQAMPNGGELQISAESVEISDTPLLPLTPGHYIKIEIADQGIGISESAIHQIFDPYYSTKETGHGLGLSICHSIIKRHNGHIGVQSKIDQGTVFTIYLPVAKDQTQKPLHATTQISQGHGKILLMDDEEIVQKIVARMLNTLGYEVEIVAHGEAALQAYQTAQALSTPFDLVIMDLTIPGGLGGKETVSKLLKIDPNARVIVSSGYSHDPVLTNPNAYGFLGTIKKPVDIKEMSQTIQDILHQT